MASLTLITGGAGFIGSHLADELLAHGYRVRMFDDLTPQVHGGADRPQYLSPEVELLVGDVRDPDAVARAVDGVDAVVHLAARVGVGQSMYELAEYTAVNSLGTAVLLETLFGLARDGRVGARVVLQLAVIFDEFAELGRPTKPPAAVQRALIAPIATWSMKARASSATSASRR